MEDRQYYIYVYFDPKKIGNYVYGEYTFSAEPFYIGKGCYCELSYTDRIDYHWKSVKRYITNDNQLNLNKIRKFDGNIPKIFKIKKLLDEGYSSVNFCYKYILNLNEINSYEIERDLILKIGRKNLKTGPLYNLTEGGEFHRFENLNPWNKGLNKENDARLKKISEDRLGQKNPAYGKPKTEKYYLALQKRKGKPNSNHNKYKYKINENIITDLKTFCQENDIVYSTVLSHFCKKSDCYKTKNIIITRIKI